VSHVNDCPLHNVVHDIALFPKYYDPIYHRLYGKCFPQKLSTSLALEPTRIFDIIANEEPTWLFHSDTLHRLHLSPLSASVPAMACRAKFLATPRDDVCSFVEHMEHLYGQDVAALLREAPFTIDPYN
jgi:hypothetical protein